LKSKGHFKEKITNTRDGAIGASYWVPKHFITKKLQDELNPIPFGKYEPIRGKLLGYLIFEKDKLTICDEIYPIETIRNIKIDNDDYSGKLVNTSKGNLGPALSNGTRNYIIVYFESGESKRHQFELINSDDFQKVRKELISYYLIGKIEFDEITNVLGEKSRSEIAELKIEIENERKRYH
jgi:hypothetical protein